ncbi:MAG: RDD family protein [archaeon]
MELNLPKKRTFAKPASVGKRLAALLIDIAALYFLFLVPIASIALAGVHLPTTFSSALQLQLPLKAYLAFGLFLLVSWLYFALFELYRRQTLGMQLMKIYLDGKLNIWKTLIRNVFIIPLFPFYLLWIVEPVHVLIFGHRFMEKLTKTRDIEFFEAY